MDYFMWYGLYAVVGILTLLFFTACFGIKGTDSFNTGIGAIAIIVVWPLILVGVLIMAFGKLMERVEDWL